MQRDAMTATEVALLCGVKRATIHKAIKTNNLRAIKHKNKWCVKIADIDEYRRNRYNFAKRKDEAGQTLFDEQAGRWSNHTAAWLTLKMNRRIKPHRILYLIKIGELKAGRYGRVWIVKREDAETLYKSLKDDQYAYGSQHKEIGA